MKSNLLLNKIQLIQSEYKLLLTTLLPKLTSSHAPEALDEINLFWLRHIEEVQLYLRTWFPNDNSYVFTASTFMDYDDNEHLPFLLMGETHVFDDPLSKYSEVRSMMPTGKDAETLYEQIRLTATDNLKLLENSHGEILILPLRLLNQSNGHKSLYEIGEHVQHVPMLQFKMSVAFVVYQLCDKERLASVNIETFLSKNRLYNFNAKLFRALTERGIDQNSFLEYQIQQLVIDELEAFYKILSE